MPSGFLKLGHSIGYLIRNIFMEKVCKKSALKTCPYPYLSLVNSPKDMKTRYFKRDHKTLIFSFAPSFFIWKGLELVTSLSLSCKSCLEKFLFWSYPLNLETVERKGKYYKILIENEIEISGTKRSF